MSLEQISANNIWEKISSVYVTPDKIKLYGKERFRKKIGYLGNDVPVELLIAAGCLPITIRGQKEKDPSIAEQYLESGFDPRVKMQMGQIVDGEYDYLDHLIVSNSSDAIVRVYYYLRALKKVELNVNFPELYFYDFLHTKLRSSSLYNLNRTYELVEILEKWCGRSIRSEDLASAIELCNETRRLIQRFSELRGPNTSYITGVQSLQMMTTAHLIPRDEYNYLLKTFLDDAKRLEPLEGLRIFVTGSTHEHTEFYELVESHGGIIVGEDHDMSIRNFEGEIDTNSEPIEAIIDYYHLQRSLPSSQSTVSERVHSLARSVSVTNSEGVIFFIHHADDAPSWDFPEQKKALESMGIPVLLIDRQQYTLCNKEEVGLKIKEFIKLLSDKSKA